MYNDNNNLVQASTNVEHEYYAIVEGLNYRVYGRILKLDDDTYDYTTSHWCKFHPNDAEVYRPGHLKSSVQEIDKLLRKYLQHFTTYDVIENPKYNLR